MYSLTESKDTDIFFFLFSPWTFLFACGLQIFIWRFIILNFYPFNISGETVFIVQNEHFLLNLCLSSNTVLEKCNCTIDSAAITPLTPSLNHICMHHWLQHSVCTVSVMFMEKTVVTISLLTSSRFPLQQNQPTVTMATFVFLICPVRESSWNIPPPRPPET